MLGALVGLALGEVVVSTVRPPVDDTSKVRSPDRFLHHAFRPGSSGSLEWGGQLVPYSIDSLGYRDRSCREVARTTLEPRVVLLGDSFVEGLGVPYEKTVASELESLLRHDRAPTEVLNAAVASFSPFLYERRLRQFFQAGFRTDVVVTFLDISDVQDEAVADYETLGRNGTFYSTVRLTMLEAMRRSRLAQEFWETIVFGSLRQREIYYRVRDRWTEDEKLFRLYGRAGADRCMRNLLAIRDLATSNGSRFHIVIYPWPTQLRSRRVPSPAEEIFGNFAASNHISLINAFPAFRSRANWSDYFQRSDAHWNEKGHRLVAELVERNLLDEIRARQRDATSSTSPLDTN